MSAKHTPGPWAAFTDDNHTNIVAFSPRTVCVFSLPGHEKNEPDVRLIAAAPELLEALETIEERISYYASLNDSEAPNIEQWAYTDQSSDMKKVRAAIAKAKGTS